MARAVATENAETMEAEPVAAEKIAEEAAPVAAENAEAKEDEPVTTEKTAAVDDAVAAAFKEAPEVPSNLIHLAGRQRMLLQKMAKETVLYSLFLSRCITGAASR